MLSRDDVVDLERRPVKVLAHLALFATAIRPLPDEPGQRGWSLRCHSCGASLVARNFQAATHALSDN
jgi:hypothetical protein